MFALKTQNIKGEKMVTWKGWLMWALLVSAYTLFVINWGIAANLNRAVASNGEVIGTLPHFFPETKGAISKTVNQAVNWGITIGRGIGSLLIGWLIVKLTHKYATLISLVLALFAIPAPWMPDYWSFITFRTFFAIGGTTLIILLQPVVSAYFSAKTKGKISIFTTWGYPLGTIITLAPFLVSKDTTEALVRNWQIIYTVIGLLFLIPLITYAVLGQRFDTFQDFKEKQEKIKQDFEAKGVKLETPSALSLLKQKETYIWILFYGGWLVAVVMPFIMARSNLPGLAQVQEANADAIRRIITIWLIFFHVAIILGPYTVGLWNKWNVKRKPFIVAVTLSGVVLWALAIVVFVYMVAPLTAQGYNMGAAGWLFFILGFLKGLLLWGIQGVFLNNPHEQEGSNPKKVGLQFSFIWGFGYFFFTFATIILSQLADIKGQGAIIWAVFVTLFMLLAPISWLFIKETKPNAPILPKFDKKDK
ncbi:HEXOSEPHOSPHATE TRANSPORT PROTEIN [Mycoplasmopsis pulmonis]|uniref:HEXOSEPHOSPHATE TRANSPORT PROTEIN n=1 Tax=Mycoplasmopsis pulmonis (strain UAB CTIP) TaxID=272635 RepID=Q98PH4_MYCPU|nr:HEXOSEPHOSPHATE TRANSPORT PROTEIN [Mycoplasmopsis pulmonis]